jgi:adenylate kinase family enzyme
MKIVIWIIGSNSSGKTTQSRLLHGSLGVSDQIISNDGDAYISYYGETISHVGKVGDNQCTGTDTLQTKAAIRASYLLALEHSNVVILDGIMATGQWYEMIREADVKLLTVLLHFNSDQANFNRVIQRRRNKGRDVDDLDDKTKENLRNKIGTFKRLFDKVTDRSDRSIMIDADMDAEEIHGLILNEINQLA